MALSNTLTEHDEKKLGHEAETNDNECEICKKIQELRDEVIKLEGK